MRLFFFIFCQSRERRMIMAAWSWFAKEIYAIGVTAAVVVLLIFIVGCLVLWYGIDQFDEWNDKW